MLSPVDSLLGFPERGGSRVRTWGVNEKCILSNPDLVPKPAYYTYQNLCSVMDDRYKVRDLEAAIKVLDQGMFYGIGVEDDAFPSVPLVAGFANDKDHYLIAYWLPWHPQEHTPDPARINLELHECGFEKPVRIDLLSGKVYEIDKFENKLGITVFYDLPLSDYPFLITELEEIDIN